MWRESTVARQPNIRKASATKSLCVEKLNNDQNVHVRQALLEKLSFDLQLKAAPKVVKLCSVHRQQEAPIKHGCTPYIAALELLIRTNEEGN